MNKDELRALVFEDMDNAVENGYKEMMLKDANNVATDMLDNSSDVYEQFYNENASDLGASNLIPYILEWQKLNK